MRRVRTGRVIRARPNSQDLADLRSRYAAVLRQRIDGSRHIRGSDATVGLRRERLPSAHRPERLRRQAERTQHRCIKRLQFDTQADVRRKQRPFAPERLTTVLNNDTCMKLLRLLASQFQFPKPTGGDWFELNAQIKACMAQADLDSGRLVAPLQASTTTLDYAYYLVYPKAKGRLKQVRAFVTWVTAEAEAHQAGLMTMDNGSGI